MFRSTLQVFANGIKSFSNPPKIITRYCKWWQMLVNTPISVLTTNMAIIHASCRGCATGQWHFGNNKLHIQRKAVENNYWRGLSVPSIQRTQQSHLLPCKTIFACRVLILWLQVMIITLYLSLCKLGSSPRLFGHWEYRHEAVPLKVLNQTSIFWRWHWQGHSNKKRYQPYKLC